MKKIFYVVVILILCGLAIIVYSRYNISASDAKFKKNIINTSIISIKEEWGIPDREFICETCSGNTIIMYNRDILGWTKYVFTFDKNTGVLIEKNIDE
jgi:hypothetical protein